MGILSKAKPTLIRVAANPFGVPVGILELVNGLPGELAPYAEKFDGAPELATGKLDGKLFALHQAREKARADAPTTPQPLEHQEVLQRFRWTQELFDEARTFNFPAPAGHRLTPTSDGGVRRNALYSVKDVGRWVKRFAALARATRLDEK